MRAFGEWFAREGWVAVLAVLCLLLVAFQLWWSWVMRRKIEAIESRFQGVNERISTNAHITGNVREELRRITGEFTPQPVVDLDEDSDPSAPTRIRK